MKKLYILKAGSSLPTVIGSEGDFDTLVKKKSGIPSSSCVTIDNFSYYRYRIPTDAGGFIITGSHSMITDTQRWMLQLSVMIRDIAAAGVPLLGICFGHQAISTALGGKVDNLPSMIEIGTSAVRQTSEAGNDLLFQNIPYSFKAFTSHTQTVTLLPSGARNLAFSKLEKFQGVCYKDENIWGVQFHPEFSTRVMKEYIKHFKDIIVASGNDPDYLMDNLEPDTHGEILLQEFCKICQVI